MRAFISLDLPDSTVAALADVMDQLPGDIRRVPEENLHLTLAFMGDVPEDAVQAAHEGLETIRAPRFGLSLNGATVYGGRHGQAIALEADGEAPLHELHDRIRARLRGAGIQLERRRFRPHVTLARLPGRGDPGPALGALCALQIPSFSVTSFSLIQSTLHESGAIYETLATYPLS
ncbi:RNA 2',3'-cyclic phosphodiesterase [Pacificoceanicola onchidii]|uniref:RNA 2',3'-cyclic phosphodiesterase n=1 Tax=Pacificoceanicola onchidii TaxID=2562685 RepID=UPI001456063B|nr:RNA 2',3'-cyclic phosphodiesterase [Pacificoceanicola onchidii]